MMRVFFVTFLASLSSGAAFTLGGPENANTALNYYRAHSRFDVPQQGSILVEGNGVAKLQGGSNVEYFVGPPIPDVEKTGVDFLSPIHDVNMQGSILIKPDGVAAVQGGSDVEFSVAPPIPAVAVDETTHYIAPKFDVPIQGSIVIEKRGAYKIQGGAVVDWWQ
jgi:hypothetical protein